MQWNEIFQFRTPHSRGHATSLLRHNDAIVWPRPHSHVTHLAQTTVIYTIDHSPMIPTHFERASALNSLASAASWVEEVGGAGSCNFPTDSSDMGAQTFNFALEFPQDGGFQPKFCIFGQNFSDKKFCDNFLTAQNFGGKETIAPLALLPATTPFSGIIRNTTCELKR